MYDRSQTYLSLGANPSDEVKLECVGVCSFVGRGWSPRLTTKLTMNVRYLLWFSHLWYGKHFAGASIGVSPGRRNRNLYFDFTFNITISHIYFFRFFPFLFLTHSRKQSVWISKCFFNIIKWVWVCVYIRSMYKKWKINLVYE